MNTWKIGLLPALLVAALFSGCTSPGGRPEWVDNPKILYPENDYLVAVGEGDTRRSAENAASANLARIFEARIESVERLSDSSLETGKQFIRITEFNADIHVLSEQTLFNIQHAEAWQDPTGRAHAVAYLDRRDTAAIYRDEIDGLTAHVHFLCAQAGESDDLITQYANLRNAVRLAAENKALLRQLKVIHPPSVPGSTPGYTESLIRKDMADTAKNIRVQIQMKNDSDGHMAAVIEELVTGNGFVVGEPAILSIEGRIGISDTGQRTANLVFIRYALAIQIKDQTGTVLVAVNENGREGHVSLNEARIRAFRTLESAIQSDGARRLDAYFDSLVDPIPE